MYGAVCHFTVSMLWIYGILGSMAFAVGDCFFLGKVWQQLYSAVLAEWHYMSRYDRIISALFAIYCIL